ncbi:hypothetical protein MNBD_GAMMA11-2378 [hydrothermal vent metagenome]|uniref:Flagellar hook-length control protein-like C-terminal domain-containing protein n=1 Tax=hydrothermal vent metagenome TaxID=652676 RepID=A0A3B0WXN1_9ZZZZ
MINIPPLRQSTPIKTELIADITRVWKVGQVLNATAEQGGNALSKVLIRVGQYTLEAKTPIALRNGQDIKLLVKTLPDNLSEQLPQLSILPPAKQTPSSPASLATARLRQFIAVQQSFSQVQLTAKQLTDNKLSTSQLPTSLNEQLGRLQDSLTLNSKSMSGAQLKQQILNSGIFFESKLLRQSLSKQSNSPSLVNDFKYQLLGIRTELINLSSSSVRPQNASQSLTPTRLNDLQSALERFYTRPQQATEASARINSIINTLSRPALTQLSTLLSTSPVEATTLNTKATQNNSSEEIAILSKALLAITQQYPQAQHVLLEQLKFRLLLTDFTQQLDQSVSKLTSLQLQPLSREADNMVLLLFNLIFKDSHEKFDLNFRIQQQNKASDESHENWLVTLSFNFKTLGKVQSKIHLMDNQLSSVFHTEYSATADKIQQLLPVLQSALETGGFNVAHLAVKNTLMEENPINTMQAHLLDENI